MAVVKVALQLKQEGSLKPAVDELNQVDAAAKKAQGGLSSIFEGFGSRLSGAGSDLGGFRSALSSIGPLGIAAGAGLAAVVAGAASAISAAAELGGQISDLAAKTGLSTDAVQAFGYAAQQTGASLDDIARASLVMQRNVAGGTGVFGQLGIGLEYIRGLKTEEQFLEVAEAIRKVQDPAKQAQLAMQAFGKGGAELLPAIRAGFAGLTEEAREFGQVVGKDALDAGDRFGDAADRATKAWQNLKAQVGGKIIGVLQLDVVLNNLSKELSQIAQGEAPLKKTGGGLLGLIDAFQGKGPDIAKAPGIAASQKALADLMKGPDTSLGLPGLDEQIKLLGKDLPKAASDAKKALAEYTKEQDEAAASAKRNAAVMKEILTTNAGAMLKSAEKETKSLFDSLENSHLGMGTGSLVAPFEKLFAPVKRDVIETKELTIDWKGALEDISNLFQSMPGMLGQVGAAIGSITAGISGAMQGFDLFSQGKKKGGLEGLLGMAGGIGQIATAGIGAVKAVIGLFKKDWTAVSQQAAKDIANAIEKGASVAQFIPNLLKDKKTALATFDQLGQQFAAMQEKYKAAVLESTKAGVGGLTAMLAHLGKKTGDTSADFARMGTYVMGLFGSLRKQGLSFVDAVAQLKPALDEMRKQAEAKGQTLTGGAADLANFSAIIEANAELVAAAEGAGQVLEGLRVSGSLTQETFTNLQTDVKGYLTELGATGLSANQALAVAAPSLYQLKKAHDELGLALDAETQAAIDAAEAQGLFDGMADPMEEMKKAMDAMVQVMAAIAQSFGVTLPAAVQEYITALNQIPTPPVPGGAPGTTGAPTGVPDGSGGPPMPGHAGGLDYVPRGPLAGGGSARIVHPGEAILNQKDASAWRAGQGEGGSFTYQAPNVTINGSGLSAAELAEMLNRVMRDNERGAVTRMRRALATRG